MNAREREALIEETVTAWRPRDPRGGIRWHPAWHDLDDAGREAAYRHTVVQRQMEAALDPAGLSATARAVLARLAR